MLMNTLICAAAGGAIGWAAFALLGFNHNRGVLVSVAIGAFGGFLGGDLLVPVINSPAPVPDGLSAMTVLLAAGAAAACVAVGDLIEKHYGV